MSRKIRSRARGLATDPREIISIILLSVATGGAYAIALALAGIMLSTF